MLPSAHEVRWRKSSYSGGEGGQCVELGVAGTAGLAVRDSKNKSGLMLAVDWRQFVDVLNAGLIRR